MYTISKEKPPESFNVSDGLAILLFYIFPIQVKQGCESRIRDLRINA